LSLFLIVKKKITGLQANKSPPLEPEGGALAIKQKKNQADLKSGWLHGVSSWFQTKTKYLDNVF
jgi:hypothetical protein